MYRPPLAAPLLILGLLALLVCLSGVSTTSAGAAKSDPVYAAWIPPGEYTAIVLCSNADVRRWNVRLMRGQPDAEQQVSIVVPPREMVVIPFERGWTVTSSQKARIESDLVPFEEFGEESPFEGDGQVLLSAWGIGPNGPVSFAYRKVRD